MNLRFDQQCMLTHGGLVLSKSQARGYIVPSNFKKPVLIRITGADEEFEELEYQEQYKNILELKFDDCFSAEHGCVITHTQGADIINFLLNNPHDLFVVHCNAGMSRSAGVMLGWTMGTDNQLLSQLIRNAAFYKPNFEVVKVLMDYFRSMDESYFAKEINNGK